MAMKYFFLFFPYKIQQVMEMNHYIGGSWNAYKLVGLI